MFKRPWFNNKEFLRSSSSYIRGKVIDVGCGNLKYKGLILNFPQVTSYTGLDYEISTKVDISADLNKKFPIANNVYDTIVCISVIEHLLEPVSAINEMYRILKPGGYILLSTPWIYPFHGEPRDYFRYSRECLEYLFKQAGFEIQTVYPSGGKARVISTILQRWLKLPKFVCKTIDLILSYIETEEKIKLKMPENSPSNKIIARKL